MKMARTSAIEWRAEKHLVKLPYRKVGADCFGYYQQYFAKGFWEEIDLENIEPLLWCCFKTKGYFSYAGTGMSKRKRN
jgi:hypothetical protein